ncbi:MraY family glycosyltransferase [Pseudolysinimonas sp.]|uniref:MraY family glycosyltransferase n=1 Tax=Pseudolysinimonas sp. TaxID=2680009 RepID=UPI003F81C132
MRIVFYVAAGGVAAVVTFVLAWLTVKLSTRYRLYPKIRERDVHTRPTPRLGGAAMFLGVLAAFLVASFLPPLEVAFSEPIRVLAVLGSAAIMVAIGIADDIWDLDWLTKLAGQIIAAGLLAWQGVSITWIPLPGTLVLLSPYVSLALTIFIVVLVMNAINFIDGLDGLVAGVAIIANGAFFICTYVITYGPTEQSNYFNLPELIAVVLVGACVGLLPLNFRWGERRPAKLFMGDGGALLVGMLMAASTISLTSSSDLNIEQQDLSTLAATFAPVILPVAVLVVPLLDFGLAVLRRLRAGKSPFSADRQHLHHRLLDMGHSHLHAVLIFYAWTAVVATGCVLLLFVPWWIALSVTLIGLVVCGTVTLAPLSRRKAIEAAAQSSPPTGPISIARLDPLDKESA